MCIGGHGTHDIIALTSHHTLNSSAAAQLLAEDIGGYPLDITLLAQGNYHIHMRNKVLYLELPYLIGLNDRTALITVFTLEIQQILLNKLQYLFGIGQQVLKVVNGLQYVLVFVKYLLALKVGQPAQLHFEYGLRLHLAQ